MKIGTFDISSLYLLEKRTIVRIFLYSGMLLAYFGSLNPWFLWPLGSLYIVPACCLIIVAMLVSNSMESPVFIRRDFLPAILSYVALLFYQLFVNGASILGFMSQIFNIAIFLALFRIDRDELLYLTTFLAKAMAVLLLVSIPCFILHLLGFSFPSRNAVFGEDALYSFTNYYFFMIEDGNLFSSILPRFTSVFLEPSHIGVAAVLLLMTQCGMWKRWYNLTLLTAVLLTFSLEAYILLAILFFLALWMQRKQFLKKMFLFVIFLSILASAAFFFFFGNNLFHDLILLRLEIEDGELAGDNRVTSDFEKDYSEFVKTSDIILGRNDMDYSTFGNSGYRVFIYENGLLGLCLLLLFYMSFMSHSKDKRAMITAFILAFLDFIVRAYPLWYSNFIPMYFMVVAYKYKVLEVNMKNYENCLYLK